ncbi:DUF58 domain-containing protein [Hydrocarboniphaga sp.]|uniref:DUF58 domain-containing protein n=1 Tax=Hydrocarboniphaga sp. TaxID=2033016 RepID=UPI003D13ED43
MILPDLDELIALQSAAQGLDLRAHRAALAQLPGGHRSAQRGRGLEFEEVRPYAEGDDRRSIDWRVTARRGRPYTKVFREDRERPAWLLADLHQALYFGSKRQLKSALLLRAAALLGWVTVGGGDRLGAVLAQDDLPPQIFSPRGRNAGVLPLLQALVKAQPRSPGEPKAQGFNSALSLLASLVKPGHLVFVLSDFSGLDSRSEALLAGIAAQCDCRLLWITDPLESSGLPDGDYRVGVPGKLRWLDGASSKPAWQRNWAAREKRIGDLALKLGLPLTRLHTADDITQTLPALLRQPAWAR